MDLKRKLLFGSLALLAVALLVIVLFRGQTDNTPPDADYYTGPRQSKWDSTKWVTADGKIVPPPKDATLSTPTTR